MWIMRLVRPHAVTYEVRETNVHPIVDGSVGELKEHFLHFSFNSGLRRWFTKHNYYSSQEAAAGHKVREQGLRLVAPFRATDAMQRRRVLKNLSYFLRGRGLFQVPPLLLPAPGLLDGTAGFVTCAMLAMYEYWIDLKIGELEKPWDKTHAVFLELLPKNADWSSLAAQTGASTAPGIPLVDVFIPTLNEAEHISETVKNALSLGPVYVLDLDQQRRHPGTGPAQAQPSSSTGLLIIRGRRIGESTICPLPASGFISWMPMSESPRGCGMKSLRRSARAPILIVFT